MVSKSLIILMGMAVAVLAKPTYTDKYDNIDLKEIMENDRLLQGYKNCLVGTGNCTPEGKELRDNLEDALKTGCEKCTEKQKDGSNQMIQFLIEKKPDIWNDLCAKFDPTGKWRKQYEDQAKAKGITIPH